MATALDDFEFAGKPSDLSDFQVVPQASTATVGKLPSAQDVSDFELATPESEKQDFLSGKTNTNSGDLSQFLTKSDPSALSPFVGESTSLADPKEHGTSLAEMENPLKNTLPRPARYRSDIEGPVSKVITGLTETAEDAIESAGSPLNALLLGGTGGLGKIGSRLMSLGFSASMAKDIPAHLEAINDATDTRDKAKAWSGLILSGLMTYAAGKHGIMGEAPVATTPEARTAQTQGELQKLAPETTPDAEPRAVPNPEFLDGLHIARKTLLKDFNEKPPEVQQARQQQIDEIDEQLLAHDKDAVSESAARTAQPRPPLEQLEQPAGAEVQGSPPVQGGRSSLFSQALSEQAPLTGEALDSRFQELLKKNAPILQAADAAKDVAPETAKAAEQIADTIASKVGEPTQDVGTGAPGDESTYQPKPAIQLPNGQVTMGEDHVSAYEEAKKTTPDTSGAKEGFVDGQGNFISREEAAAKTGLPTDTEPGKLHSSDLPEAKGETPDIGTFKPEKMTQLMAQLGEDEPVSETPPARKTLTKEETIAALNRELDSARDDDRTHDVTRLKKRIKELSTQSAPEAERVVNDTSEAAAEPPKEAWQKTRDEVKDEGSSLTTHRSEVRSAVAEGKQVPLEVLEGFSGFKWADDARKKLYGDQISDTFLGKILKGLSDDPSKMMSDPLFIQSVGKPTLRLAVRILQESINAGKLGHDAVADAINYLKTKIPDLNEEKAKEFFHQVFEKPAPESQPKASSVETPPELVSGGTRPESVSAPVEADGARLTSTKNAVVDEERVKRGEPPILSEAKKSLGEVWEEAMRKIEYDPNAGTNLVKELNGKPRAINAVEEATLLHHKVTVSNDLARQTERALSDTASDAERMESRVEAARLTDELNDIDNATRKAGTEWGRTGRFRQVLAAEDYSLARMLQQKQLAKGEALTPEETEQVSKLSARIAELEKQSAEHEEQKAAMEDKLKDSEADRRIAEISAKQTPAEKYAQGLVQKIQQGLKSQADAARERIRARLGKASAGVDPVVIYDAAIIGAEKLFSAGLDFAKWSKGMIEDLGEFIQPHLEEIWDKSKAINEDAVEKGAPKPLREKIKAKAATDADKRNAIVETIRSRKGANEAIGSQIQKLAENFVRNGITEREALVSAVHDAVKDALPEATPRDIRDAISGYGDFKELSKDETKAKLRDLKGQMQQLSKIEDITAEGKAKKTGVQRRIPTAEERRLLAEVNRVKKEYGIESDDPEALASALGAAKTRLRNRIEDLKTSIAKGEKLPAKGKKIVDDDETAQLRKDKDALQAEYDAAFGNPKPTVEQIAADKAQQAVDKVSAALDRQQRINSGEIKPEAKEKAQPLSALEKELRDRTEELREAKRKADAYKSPADIESDKAQKAVDRAAAALDRAQRIASGELRPDPKEKSKPLSSLEKELRDRTEELNRAQRTKTPEQIATERAQRGVDAAAAAMDHWDRILKGELEPESKAASGPSSNLEEEMRSQVEAMKRAAAEIRRDQRPKTLPEKAQLEALEKSIADYERRVKEMDFSTNPKRQGPDTKEIADAKALRDSAKAAYDELKKAQTPKLSPDEIALKVYKTRTAKRIADLQERVKNGDFASKPRKTVELDSEGLKLKADAERAKLDFDRANYRDKLKNRSTWEKMADVFPKVSRAFLLSSPATIGKLLAAAMWRMVATPVEEGIGAGLSKLPYVSDIAARAPREGGSLGVQGEAKVFTRGVTKGMKDALDMLRKGETDLDVVGGKKNIIPHEWIDFIGNMHGAMKSVAKRNEFERSFQKRSEFNMRHGVDVTDPLVQSRMMVEAYQDANRSIFQQDNRVVSIWNTAMKRLEEKSKITGRPTVSGKVGQVVGKTLLPIVKIPTNIVAETLQYATGALTGSARVAAAFRRGVETLKPEEADLIMRDLKKGSLGAAVMTLGFLAPQVIGGYYQYGKKRRDDDVKAGNVKLYGQNIPPTMLHNPAVEQLQIGATVRRVADSKLRNKDQDTQGIPAGVLAAALGITSEVPFVHETIDVAKLFNPYERSQFMGQLAKSRLEPAILQQAAAHFDKDASGEPVQRDPKTVGEYLKTGIPGLREQVPQKRGRLNRAFAPRYAR